MGIWAGLQQPFQSCLGVVDRVCQSLVVVGGEDAGSQSGRGDHCVKRVCRPVVQGGRGDGVVQCVSCGVCVESGDADEGVEYAGGMSSGAVQLQG